MTIAPAIWTTLVLLFGVSVAACEVRTRWGRVGTVLSLLLVVTLLVGLGGMWRAAWMS